MNARVLWAVVALSLPLGLLGVDRSASAQGATVVPTPEDGFRGVPDLSEDSGRFLVVSGILNAGIPGSLPGEDPQQLVLALRFDADSLADDVRIAVFDGDTAGLWDQRDDRPPVSPEPGIRRLYDTRYRVYADPTGGVARALARGTSTTPDAVVPVDDQGLPETDANGDPLPAVSPVLNVNALGPVFAGTNAEWIELLSQEGEDGARIEQTNEFLYTLRVNLERGALPLSGFEANGFKVASSGTAVLPRGTILGFVGGVVDIRTVQQQAQSEDPLPGVSYRPPGRNDVLTNRYAGLWDFPFEPRQVCDDLTLFEADADWNAPIGNSPLGDTNPTGIPPDDGGRYVFNNQVIDNTSLRIPLGAADVAKSRHGLVWELLDPSGDVRLSSDDTPLGHPSYTGSRQAQEVPIGDPFQAATISKAALNGEPGVWVWQWRGVDSRNAIWVKASGGLGALPGGATTSGRVWCDDGDGVFEAGETPVAMAMLVFAPVPPSDFLVPVTADAEGRWSTKLLTGGTWSLQSVNAPPGAPFPFVPATALPRTFTVDPCQDTTLDVPGTCEQVRGRIAGRVWCDNDEDGQYDTVGDKPLSGVSVTITEKGQAAPVETLTTAADGAYQSSLLPVGDYVVAVDPTQPAVGGATTLSPVSVDAKVVANQTTIVDFRFRCRARVSGHVVREVRPCDGSWQKDKEFGIPGVDVVLTLLDSQGFPTATTRTAATDVAGAYLFADVTPGTYRLTVGETQSAVVRLAASTSTTIGPLAVAPLTSYPDNDFFFCPGEIQVRVFKKARGQACRNLIETGDTPIAGVQVVLAGTSATTTPGPFQAVTDAAGTATFTNLDADTYAVSVSGAQALLVALEPAAGAAAQNVLLPPGQLKVVPSVWCESLCSITGFVLREAECVPWWADGGKGIGAVTVTLRRGTDLPADPPFATTVTSSEGFFAFLDIPQGAYVVSVPSGQNVLRFLTATTPTTVRVAQCPAEVVFRYGTAGLWVRVLVDLDCGGTPDQGLETTVTFEKLDAPGQGLVITGSTGADGTLRLPRPNQAGLWPGAWRVSIPPRAGLIPKGPLTRDVVLEVCKPQRLDFEFCALGSLVGTVVKETVDCDGVRQSAEPGIPGVLVRLTPVSPAGPVRTTTTDAQGNYAFTNLPRGTYVVAIDGAQPALVDLNPSSPTQVPVVIVPPDEARVDFTLCAPGQICGTVYREPLEDCDGQYGAKDQPLAGVVVQLAPIDPPGVVLQTVTRTDGSYCFRKLDPGRYEVSVDGRQPLLVSLSATTAAVVAVLLPPSGRETADFGFAPQALRGIVFQEPVGACDGRFEAGVDRGLGGVTIQIVKLDAPTRGLTRTTNTNAQGRYRFDDIPAGRYEVSVIAGVPKKLIPTTPQVVTLGIPVCKERRVDFGYCPPERARISGTVFREPWGDCEGVYDDADVGIPGVTVRLEKLDAPGAGRLRETVTDAKGDYGFKDVPAGQYRVSVPGGQAQLVSLTPSTPEVRVVTARLGEEVKDVDFGYCPPCPKVPCCEGDLHEVVVETRFWVDDGEEWYDVYTYLKDGCEKDAAEIDYAGIYFHGDFPGAVTGYNDVITLENVWREGNWLYVRLRLTAQGCAFPRGFFGPAQRAVVVTLGEQKRVGCVVFRCEYVRPGSWFTWTDACGFPDCPPESDPQILSSGGWDDQPRGCDAHFRVLDTYGWENWLICEGRPECEDQSRCCRCGYNLVELELDYWVKRGDDAHRYAMTLWKWGHTSIDGLMLDFRGDTWEGMKRSESGLATLLGVRLVEQGEYADLWRARLRVQACDRLDRNPGVLPEQLEIRSVLDDGQHDYWLDLNYTSNPCLKVGPILWQDEFTGVNLLRWLSVLDAAWCPPVCCIGSCTPVPCTGCPPVPKPCTGCPPPVTVR